MVSLRWLLGLAVAAVVLASVSFAGQRHAARAATLPACTMGHTTFDYATQAATTARRVAGTVVAVTSVGTWGTSACLLHDRLMFAVQDASDRFSPRGVIRSVAGNPAARAVNLILRPGDLLLYSWRWRNWCGARSRFILQASWKALPFTTPSQAVKPPSCVDRGSRSTLSATRPSIRVCPTTGYQVTTGLGQPFMTRLIDLVEISLRKDKPPCILRHLHINFAVQGQNGGNWATLAPVEGNPATRTIGTLLTHNYGGFLVFWAWANWCHGGNHFRTSAKVGARTVTGATDTQGATCGDTGAPSTLTPNYGHS